MQDANDRHSTRGPTKRPLQFTCTRTSPIAPGRITIGAGKDGFADVKKTTTSGPGSRRRTQDRPAVHRRSHRHTAGVTQRRANRRRRRQRRRQRARAQHRRRRPGLRQQPASWVFIILGGLLVALGVGAIVLAAGRRKEDGEADEDGGRRRPRRAPQPRRRPSWRLPRSRRGPHPGGQPRRPRGPDLLAQQAAGRRADNAATAGGRGVPRPVRRAAPATAGADSRRRRRTALGPSPAGPASPTAVNGAPQPGYGSPAPPDTARPPRPASTAYGPPPRPASTRTDRRPRRALPRTAAPAHRPTAARWYRPGAYGSPAAPRGGPGPGYGRGPGGRRTGFGRADRPLQRGRRPATTQPGRRWPVRVRTIRSGPARPGNGGYGPPRRRIRSPWWRIRAAASPTSRAKRTSRVAGTSRAAVTTTRGHDAPPSGYRQPPGGYESRNGGYAPTGPGYEPPPAPGFAPGWRLRPRPWPWPEPRRRVRPARRPRQDGYPQQEPGGARSRHGARHPAAASGVTGLAGRLAPSDDLARDCAAVLS